jgi:UPF0716 protein FxsA
MPLLILLILIGLPMAEISLFIEVGGEIGAGSTIILTIFTAVAGLALARLQGFAVLARMQESMARGQPPVGELIHGFFLFIAGIFLFLPGFLTDAIGVLLLLPPVRILLGRAGLQRFASGRQNPHTQPDSAGNVEIEGVYWEGDDDNDTGDTDQDDPDNIRPARGHPDDQA